ncbi:MAG: trypsin-like serine protease, partial [Nannocystaceae bacterium]
MTKLDIFSLRSLCLLAIAASACASEADPDSTLDSAQQAVEEDSEGELAPSWASLTVENPERDLERLYLDPGRYRVVDPDGLELGARVVDGPLTWEHVGPQEFLVADVRPATTQWQAAAPDASAADPIEQLRRTVRVDAHGRRWAVVDIDEAALRAELDEHAHEHAHEHGHALVSDLDHRREHADLEDVPGDGEWITPLAWGRYDCMPQGSTDGVDDQFLSDNTENRFDIGSPSGRQTKAVMIDLNDSIYGFGATCSGVLVDDQYVLTAAHCVSNTVGGVAWPEVVCPLGNN